MNQDKPVLISYPCGDMVHADFTQCLTMMCAYSTAIPQIWYGVSQTRSSIICAGRNMQVEQALRQPGGVSHMLFLDSDMTFPANTLERLLSHNLDMVGAAYCMRREPRAMTHRDLNFGSYLPAIGEVPGDLLQVLSMGMGCVLIHMRVFEALRAADPLGPFFQVEYHGADHHTGEDGHFYRLANQARFTAWIDIPLSHAVRHVGTYAYGPADVQKVYDGSEPRFDHEDQLRLPGLGEPLRGAL